MAARSRCFPGREDGLAKAGEEAARKAVHSVAEAFSIYRAVRTVPGRVRLAGEE